MLFRQSTTVLYALCRRFLVILEVFLSLELNWYILTKKISQGFRGKAITARNELES